jgi:alpha-galactosidase
MSWTSATNGWGPVERDRSVNGPNGGDGRTLTLNGTTYAKGLGVHANSSVSYTLPAGCTTFRSDIGVDDESTTAGSVVFRVAVNGTKVYESGVMKPRSATKSVSVDLGRNTNPTTLTLIVTDAGDGNVSDHADWANARVTC